MCVIMRYTISLVAVTSVYILLLYMLFCAEWNMPLSDNLRVYNIIPHEERWIEMKMREFANVLADESESRGREINTSFIADENEAF